MNTSQLHNRAQKQKARLNTVAVAVGSYPIRCGSTARRAKVSEREEFGFQAVGTASENN